jgi:hypothetical protein
MQLVVVSTCAAASRHHQHLAMHAASHGHLTMGTDWNQNMVLGAANQMQNQINPDTIKIIS